MSEIYVSIDIETDGPIPAKNSMLSIGSAAFDKNGNMLDTWEVNLETLPGATPDLRTKEEFWDKNPKAWEACRKNLVNPKKAMHNYVNWLKSIEKKFDGRVVAVCHPAGFDFTFVYWYLMEFAQYSPFSFSCIDIKTYAMAVLKKEYRQCTKGGMPKRWFDLNAHHTHIALDDAIEQGKLFCNMLKENILG